ncbi:hypothetical protein Glove_117g99 [Diversispora epigaea]|uniref:Uncharacterized protein n=1 Tax=Diversispora epigaea TaxID=1348612 RepID=A0A397J4X8_9GLOM|nr:hypothetical protein Glove_117g99 [Diversispora epigaea]
MYFDSLGIEKDIKKKLWIISSISLWYFFRELFSLDHFTFQIYLKLADKMSLIALNWVTICHERGFEAFGTYLKSVAQFNVARCYRNGNGIRIAEDETKGFQYYHFTFQIYLKLADKMSLIALNWVTICHERGFEAFGTYLKSVAQFNVARCYRNGNGIRIAEDETKGFQYCKY